LLGFPCLKIALAPESATTEIDRRGKPGILHAPDNPHMAAMAIAGLDLIGGKVDGSCGHGAASRKGHAPSEAVTFLEGTTHVGLHPSARGVDGSSPYMRGRTAADLLGIGLRRPHLESKRG
jgi:hypothetical protein